MKIFLLNYGSILVWLMRSTGTKRKLYYNPFIYGVYKHYIYIGIFMHIIDFYISELSYQHIIL